MILAMKRPTVTREEWLKARLELLAEEKAFTRQRDALSRKRRELPWVEVETDYSFDGPEGTVSLAELFGERSQLLIYHFMYGADWEAGCPSCSFWADNFDGIDIHLAHRDIAFAAISKAPLATLEAFRSRMGWRFRWLSAADTNFNEDFGVSFEGPGDAPRYNFGTSTFSGTEAPGASAFYKDEDGRVFHTYSTYSRGLDVLNGAYHWMDLAPKGRDEDDLPYTMAWLRRRDEY